MLNGLFLLLLFPSIALAQGARQTVIAKQSRATDSASASIPIASDAKGVLQVHAQLDLADTGKELIVELWVDHGRGFVKDSTAKIVVGALGKDGKPQTEAGFNINAAEYANLPVQIRLNRVNKGAPINAGATYEIKPDAQVVKANEAAVEQVLKERQRVK